MRRRLLVGLVAAGVVVAVGALVVATTDGSKDEAPTLVVPRVTGTGIVRAYDLARAAGFRVAVSNGFSVSALCEPGAERQVPRSGALLRAGGVVAINAGVCALGSPAVRRPMPTAVVPDFNGKTASDVVDWAETQEMFWWIRGASPLSAGSAPHLLDNYRVVRQSPRPGASLRPGVFVRSGGARGFRPTPITVWVSVDSPAVGSAATAPLSRGNEASTRPVRACTPSELRIGMVRSTFAAGNVGGYIGFTSRSSHACGLSGWPTLLAIPRTGAPTVARHDRTTMFGPNHIRGLRPPVVILAPGKRADAVFAGGDMPGSGQTSCPPPYRYFRVRPPGSSRSVVLSAWLARLDAFMPSCAGISVTMVVPASALYRG